VALPTFYPTEAQPISLIEGIAFGCIPLTTRHNYNEDFLEPAITMFVEKRSTEAIVEALRSLIVNPSEAATRMRLAYAIANEKFDMMQFVNAIDRVVDEAIQGTFRCRL
jgi:glycosyltransferase involved in cell wall biosynthesis